MPSGPDSPGRPVLCGITTTLRFLTDLNQRFDCHLLDEDEKIIWFPRVVLAGTRLFCWLDNSRSIGKAKGRNIFPVAKQCLDPDWRFNRFLAGDSFLAFRADRSAGSRRETLTTTLTLDGGPIDQWEGWDRFPDSNGRPGQSVSDLGRKGRQLIAASEKSGWLNRGFKFDYSPATGSLIYGWMTGIRVAWSLSHESKTKKWNCGWSGLRGPTGPWDLCLSKDGMSAYVSTQSFDKSFALYGVTAGRAKPALMLRGGVGDAFSRPIYEARDAELVAAAVNLAST